MKWAIRGLWTVGVSYGWAPLAFGKIAMEWPIIGTMYREVFFYAPFLMTLFAATAVAGLVGLMSMFGYRGWKHHKVIIICGVLALVTIGWMTKDTFNSEEV